MSDIIPTIPVGSGNGSNGAWNGGWGDAVGAFAGALFGSWFGGGRGPAGEGAAPASTAALDLQSVILQGQNASNLAMSQGFAGVTNAANQGFAGLNTAVLTGDMGIQNTLAQGFAGINAAVAGAAKDAALQACQITQAIGDAACGIRTAILAEGQAVRDLVNANAKEGLLAKLAEVQAENAMMKQTARIVSALKTDSSSSGG